MSVNRKMIEFIQTHWPSSPCPAHGIPDVKGRKRVDGWTTTPLLMLVAVFLIFLNLAHVDTLPVSGMPFQIPKSRDSGESEIS